MDGATRAAVTWGRNSHHSASSTRYGKLNKLAQRKTADRDTECPPGLSPRETWGRTTWGQRFRILDFLDNAVGDPFLFFGTLVYGAGNPSHRRCSEEDSPTGTIRGTSEAAVTDGKKPVPILTGGRGDKFDVRGSCRTSIPT